MSSAIILNSSQFWKISFAQKSAAELQVRQLGLMKELMDKETSCSFCSLCTLTCVWLKLQSVSVIL
jgi:hypothetical protein